MEISSLNHFSHDHRLYLRYNIEERDNCGLCRLPISSSSEESHYGCEYECNYYIHSSCAKFPEEMVHPFHPQHTLTVQRQEEEDLEELISRRMFDKIFSCNFCKCIVEGFFFKCSMCDFIMDYHCAAMKFIRGDCPSWLLICANNNICSDIMCDFCKPKTPTEVGTFVFCLNRKAFMHESCAELSILSKFQHILHPQHLLKPAYNARFICNACGKADYPSHLSFCCEEECEFKLHLRCALLRPTSTTNDVEGHPDKDLIECYRKKNSLHFDLSCSGCMQLFKEEESIYVCRPWKQVLHKSCAHSPKQIVDHPFHLAHPLSLLDETPNDTNERLKKYKCMACMKSSYKLESHFYGCCDCNFYLHTKCALPVPPTLNSQSVVFHQHPLAFLDIREDLLCSTCKLICHSPFFRCVECDFNLHVHCFSVLPTTVKHKCHQHPLTLTRSPVKNHEDEEDDASFSCDACWGCIPLNEPTYYCADCHYIAHVHCVISEIFPECAEAIAGP